MLDFTPTTGGARLTSGLEEGYELLHRALHPAGEGDTFPAPGREADSPTRRISGTDGGGDNRTDLGREHDVNGGASSSSVTDPVTRDELRTSAVAPECTPTSTRRAPLESARNTAVACVSVPCSSSEQTSTLSGRCFLAAVLGGCGATPYLLH